MNRILRAILILLCSCTFSVNAANFAHAQLRFKPSNPATVTPPPPTVTPVAQRHPSVTSIRVKYQDRTEGIGSCVCIHRKGNEYTFITAKHAFRKPAPQNQYWKWTEAHVKLDGEWVKVYNVTNDPGDDASAVKVKFDGEFTVAELDPTVMEHGEPLTFAGQGNNFKVIEVATCAGDLLDLAEGEQVITGDSGTGVFDASQKLRGIVIGYQPHNRDRGVYVSLNKVKALLPKAPAARNVASFDAAMHTEVARYRGGLWSGGGNDVASLRQHITNDHGHVPPEDMNYNQLVKLHSLLHEAENNRLNLSIPHYRWVRVCENGQCFSQRQWVGPNAE